MPRVTTLHTEDDARRLAAHLLDAGRTHPVAVVAVGVGRDEPWIDPVLVADGVGDYAEVYRVPTGDVTWALSAELPSEAQVFGDAARVYSTDLAWVDRPRASRLYLCHGPAQGPRIAESLIADAMQDAVSAGLFAARDDVVPVVTGKVRGILASRAMVRGDFGMAVVREELVHAGVAIDRLLTEGMEVTGRWDRTDGLLDLRDRVRRVDEALADYAVGDVILAQVGTVGSTRAVLHPYPGLNVEIGVGSVTGNLHDRLTDLMSPGEVVRVRVIRTERPLLSMLDVEDDEEAQVAPSLLDGGPPWLVEPSILVPAPPVDIDDPTLPAPDDRALPEPEPAIQDDPDVVSVRVQTPTSPAPDEPTARPRPSPLDLDPRRRVERAQSPVRVQPAEDPTSVQPTTEPTPRARELHLEREARTVAERQIVALRSEANQHVDRLARLERVLKQTQAELERKKTETRELKRKLRASGPVPVQADEVLFFDPADQLRHEVYLTWAATVPAGEKSVRQLPEEWRVGPRFLDSVERLQGISRHKILEVVVQVLTGQAREIPGRALNPLRNGASGDAPQLQRADGARCWRVSLQTNTPSARRLHFWRDGSTIELSRVVLHDDMDP